MKGRGGEGQAGQGRGIKPGGDGMKCAKPEPRKEIHIKPIKEGTAIDHLSPGTALKILRILDIGENPATVAMNVPSRKMGRKDLIFIDGKKLDEREINKIAIIGKGATVNIIRNHTVTKKMRIGLPGHAEGIIRCINPNCITNVEKIPTKFTIRQGPTRATCFYCENRMNEREIQDSIV